MTTLTDTMVGEDPAASEKQYTVRVWNNDASCGDALFVGTPEFIVTALRTRWMLQRASQNRPPTNPFVTDASYGNNERYMYDLALAAMYDTGYTPAFETKGITPVRFLRFMHDVGKLRLEGDLPAVKGFLSKGDDVRDLYRNRLRQDVARAKNADDPMPTETWL